MERRRSAVGAYRTPMDADETALSAHSALNNDLPYLFVYFVYFVIFIIILLFLSLFYYFYHYFIILIIF